MPGTHQLHCQLNITIAPHSQLVVVAQVSGTLPSEFSNITNIKQFYLYGAKFSGSLPAEWSQLQKLKVLFLHNNHLSGTISDKLSQLTQMSTFHIGGNQMIHGSIPSGFRNMTQMTNFLCNSNQELSFDLDIEKSWSNLQHLVISETATRGTIPADMLTNSTNISTFLMARTQISSTVPPQSVFPPSVDLSGSKLSGLLPPNAVNAGTRGLLLNDLKLSGSLPAGSARRVDGVTDKIAFAASRGYFTGKIPDQFNSKLGFETLILSSNRFSCNAPGMDGAANLGVGQFVEPVVAALKAIGDAFVEDRENKVVTSPFASLTGTYKNAVHIFAGNPYLGSNAGRVSGWTGPGIPASRVVRQDIIRQGKVSEFTEHSRFKEYFIIMLPAITLFHVLAIVVLACLVWQTETRKLYKYFCMWDPRQAYRSEYKISLWFLNNSFKSCRVLGLCGVTLLLINCLGPKVYSQVTCIDWLLFTSISSIETSTWYQWVWVLSCCLSFSIQGWLTMKMLVETKSLGLGTHTLLVSQFPSLKRTLLMNWRCKIRSHWILRYSAYGGLIAVTLAFISLPTFAFILVNNIPAETSDEYGIKILGNAQVTTLLNIVISMLVVPAACDLLAEVKHGMNAVLSVRTELALPMAKTISNNIFFFEIGGQVIAPILFQFVLDESCLRSLCL